MLFFFFFNARFDTRVFSGQPLVVEGNMVVVHVQV